MKMKQFAVQYLNVPFLLFATAEMGFLKEFSKTIGSQLNYAVTDCTIKDWSNWAVNCQNI